MFSYNLMQKLNVSANGNATLYSQLVTDCGNKLADKGNEVSLAVAGKVTAEQLAQKTLQIIGETTTISSQDEMTPKELYAAAKAEIDAALKAKAAVFQRPNFEHFTTKAGAAKKVVPKSLKPDEIVVSGEGRTSPGNL